MILFALEIARNFYFISHRKIIDFSSLGAVSTLTAEAGKLCVNNWGWKKGSVLVPCTFLFDTTFYESFSSFMFVVAIYFRVWNWKENEHLIFRQKPSELIKFFLEKNTDENEKFTNLLLGINALMMLGL